MPQLGATEVELRRAGPHSRGLGLSVSYGEAGGLLMALDVVLVVAVSTLAGSGYHLAAFGETGPVASFFGAGAATAALFATILQARGLYRPNRLIGGTLKQAGAIVLTWTAVFAFLASLAFLLKVSHQFSRGAVTLFFVAGLATTLGSRCVVARALARAIASGALSGRRAILLADHAEPAAGALLAGLVQYGYRIGAVFRVSLGAGPSRPLGEADERTIAELVAHARTHEVDEILLFANWTKLPQIQEVAARLRVLPLAVRLLADGEARRFLHNPVSDLGPTAAVELQRAPLTAAERAGKRAFDLVLGTAAFVALAPLMLVVAAAIRWESPGPVFFRQTRVGFNGRKFRIYKFRTMTALDDGAVVRQATREDERVTRLGRWLRRTSIDELPQLLNVISGEMSLVGPRPHALAHDSEFDRLVANYALRHHVKPGITGWAQAHGLRGETDTHNKLERRVEFDLYYINHWSPLLDLRILAMTVFCVLRGANAY